MHLTTKARYAVIAVLGIASQNLSTPVRLIDIAIENNISLSYLEQIFFRLKKAKLVRAVKGPKGGYIINYKLSDIKIINIIDAVEENVSMTKCDNSKNYGCIFNNKRCNAHYLWVGLTDHIRDYLAKISVEDILATNHQYFV